ncbi:MAG: IspD/TarI family cytidylyltransferase [Lachnospiraceae bacterium]|nr:IspD/TarI family cytidylyltransferase [Lachnospiraceae bacterium]
MNVALVFAGGAGIRMNSKAKPKQFLELNGKEILVYTLEVFEKHPEIDKIVVVCLEDWIDYTKKLIKRYELEKVVSVVKGGKNTQESQYIGLREIASWNKKDVIVLIHDGVRPLIDFDTITRNIEGVKKYGSAITVTEAIETIVYVDQDETMNDVIDRKKCRMAKAPQSYYLKDVLEVHHRAISDGNLEYIDSACMMQDYGIKIHTVEGNEDNIKITTPKDFYLFRAILEAKENSQIWGIN